MSNISHRHLPIWNEGMEINLPEWGSVLDEDTDMRIFINDRGRLDLLGHYNYTKSPHLSRKLAERLGYPTDVPEFPSKLNCSFEEKFGDPDVVPSLHARRIYLSYSRSVVSLSSFAGGVRLFSCSGLVLCTKRGPIILTSASLVAQPRFVDCSFGRRKPTMMENGKSILYDDLKITVALCDEMTSCEGTLLWYDLHYNVALVTVEASVSSFLVPIPSSQLLVGAVSGNPEVYALGRLCNSGELMAACGRIIESCEAFDCKELGFSSCRITKGGIGGPLVNLDGIVVGFNFYGIKVTPFIPNYIVLRCLKCFEDDKKFRHPWLGMDVRAISTFELGKHEKYWRRYGNVDGLVVEKVEVGLPAHTAGIRHGDWVEAVESQNMVTISEYIKRLWDMSENFSKKGVAKIKVTFRNGDVQREVHMNVVERKADEYYRWAVPAPYWDPSQSPPVVTFC